jgi:hypothetical protein
MPFVSGRPECSLPPGPIASGRCPPGLAFSRVVRRRRRDWGCWCASRRSPGLLLLRRGTLPSRRLYADHPDLPVQVPVTIGTVGCWGGSARSAIGVEPGGSCISGSLQVILWRYGSPLSAALSHAAGANSVQCEVANRPGRIEPRELKRRRHGYKLMQEPRDILRPRLAKHK